MGEQEMQSFNSVLDKCLSENDPYIFLIFFKYFFNIF